MRAYSWSAIIDPHDPSDLFSWTCDVHLDLGPGFESAWLFPGGFMLAATLEKFTVPVKVGLTLHDRSTLARLGLSVGNTVIHPGSRGFQTLELWNHGPRSITLTQGMPIAQLVQHECYGREYIGRYQDQTRGPHEARL